MPILFGVAQRQEVNRPCRVKSMCITATGAGIALLTLYDAFYAASQALFVARSVANTTTQVSFDDLFLENGFVIEPTQFPSSYFVEYE